MKENKYNDEVFFNKYLQMDRSVKGLQGAGEWHEFKKMMPDFKDKSVLDLGCGLGWHCQYAIENGAKTVVGVDISSKMLDFAKENTDKKIKYILSPIEDLDFSENSFDIIISSLTFHYIEDFNDLVKNIFKILKDDGDFIFSVENPIFTAEGSEKWVLDANNNIIHWPVDNYFDESLRNTSFLGENVRKFHRTYTTYLNTLLKNNFSITSIVEPKPDETMLNIEGMKDELRRPMMLLVSSKK